MEGLVFDIRNQESKGSEIRNQKSEVRNQESEVVNPSATTAHNLFKVVLCRAGLTEFYQLSQSGSDEFMHGVGQFRVPAPH
jgi:hypothetical protein